MKSRMFAISALYLALFFVHHVSVFGQDLLEASLEMVPGNYGFIQEYKISFRSDGTASFHGKKGVSLIGKYHGIVTKEDFTRLAELITKNNFFSLKTEVSLSSASFPTNLNVSTIVAPIVITSVKLSNKNKRTIRRPITADVKINSPSSPPKELLEIESEIITLSKLVKWQKDPK